MHLNRWFSFPLFLLLLVSCQVKNNYDIAVIGGGASGTCAAIQSARLGSKTLLLEPTSWLGGMLTSAGVSAVDGNYQLRSGLWGEFLNALSEHYGSLDSLRTGWVSNVLFEPSVGNQIFQKMVAQSPLLSFKGNASVESVRKLPKGWRLLINNNGKREEVDVSYVIDATELGDIAKMAGLPYHAGMDSSLQTGEPQAPKVANNIVQDMTYVVTIQQYDKPHLIARPAGYSPLEFKNSCLCQYNDSETWQKPWPAEMMISYGRLPNKKYMLNWPMFGNDIYLNDIEFSPAQRDSLHQEAKAKAMRYLYFIQNELEMKNLGLADEYPTADKLPLIPYYREGRRFKGAVLFTLNDILSPYSQTHPLYRTAVAVGDYPVDHHHHAYQGKDLPDIHFPSIPSYGVPLGVVIPEKEDRLLLAEKSVSVTNLVNGTTRLQPVSMQIGQVAGTLAALAVKEKVAPRKVSVRTVQRALLESGNYLLPYLDVDKSDPAFRSLQRIGVVGILHGKGKHVGWSNQTWLEADSILNHEALANLSSVYPSWKAALVDQSTVSLRELENVIKEIATSEKLSLPTDLDAAISEIYIKFRLGSTSLDKAVTRKQMAVLIDQLLHPFETRDVNLFGEFISHE